MLRATALLFSLCLSLAAFRAAEAAELVMVEQDGCGYCREWHKVIGPIYPRTPEGAFAPLRTVDIRDGAPAGVTYARRVVYTPTFILVEDGLELARIEGYPGEDFFWGLLGMMLKAKTSYQEPVPAPGPQQPAKTPGKA